LGQISFWLVKSEGSGTGGESNGEQKKVKIRKKQDGEKTEQID